VYRLFLTISLWFGLTAWGMLAIVFLGFHLRGMREVSAPNMYAIVAPILAAEAVRTYESGGPEAFARFSQSDVANHKQQLFLLDGFYKDVLSRPLTSEGLGVAHTPKNGQLVMLRNDIAAYRFISSLGHPYTLMPYFEPDLRKLGDALSGGGLPYAIYLILLVTLLCFAACVSYCVTDPQHSVDGEKSNARRSQSTDTGSGVQAL
jgi:two-component system, OmpR family, sensor histidine kinase CpxA